MKKNFVQEIEVGEQRLKYFYIFSTFYTAVLLVSLVVAGRLSPLHLPFTAYTIFLTGGTWTIPFTFFLQDIMTEVYGYHRSRNVVYLAVFIVVVAIGYFKITTFLPLPHDQNIDNCYNTIFNILPRHLFALLAAITIGNLANNYLLSTLKRYFHGKYLPFRFISSTAVGEAILQLIGTTVAWFGTLHFANEILPFVIFSYGYKILFEAAMTPVNVCLCHWLKSVENFDTCR